MARRGSDNHGDGTRGEKFVPLDRELLVRTALSILSDEGLNHLSMRKLADSLDVKASALYWHIKDKHVLLQLVADKICEEIQWSNEDITWQEKVFFGMSSYRKALLRYRDSAEIFADTSPNTPNRKHLIKNLIETLMQCGFTPQESFMTSGLLNNYVIGFVMDELRISRRADKIPPKNARVEQPPMDSLFQHA